MMRMIGTVQYSAPPEALENGNLTTAADIWAIGCIGWELFTGSRLFENEPMIQRYKKGVLHIDPIILSSLEEYPRMHEILSGCLDSRVANRWDIWTLQAKLGPFGAPV
jgi:serine/threonine protein kinase